MRNLVKYKNIHQIISLNQVPFIKLHFFTLFVGTQQNYNLHNNIPRFNKKNPTENKLFLMRYHIFTLYIYLYKQHLAHFWLCLNQISLLFFFENTLQENTLSLSYPF